jgi:hypothetical protein
LNPRFVAPAALLVVLAAWTFLYWQIDPAKFFGDYHDDAILMVSAKALATGKGYRLLHLPNTPVATKYPVLYPLLLSAVWRWNPNFPANLTPALAIQMVFGWLAIVACYFLARHYGLGRVAATLIATYCAFHVTFILHAIKVLTDSLAMALTLWAAILADRALESGGSNRAMVLAGVLAMAATLARTIGVTLVLAAITVAIFRKRYRLAGLFVAVTAPLITSCLLLPGNDRGLDAWLAQAPAGFRESWA